MIGAKGFLYFCGKLCCLAFHFIYLLFFHLCIKQIASNLQGSLLYLQLFFIFLPLLFVSLYAQTYPIK